MFAQEPVSQHSASEKWELLYSERHNISTRSYRTYIVRDRNNVLPGVFPHTPAGLLPQCSFFCLVSVRLRGNSSSNYDIALFR